LVLANPHTLKSVRLVVAMKGAVKRARKRIGTAHRIGLDYFDKKKFQHLNVKEKIAEVFGESPYKKILVVWDVASPDVVSYAESKYGIDIWVIRDLIEKLGKQVSGSRDDVLRLAELFYHSARVDRYEMQA